MITVTNALVAVPQCNKTRRHNRGTSKGKQLNKRLEEGNRTLYAWLASVANLSSLSTKPTTRQQSIDMHATFTRLSEAQMGRLRRLADLPAPSSWKTPKCRFALGRGQTADTQLLTAVKQRTDSSHAELIEPP